MYPQKYNVIHSEVTQREKLIPVASKWLGSWRVSIDRRAHSAVEITARYDQEAATWEQTLKRLGVTSAYQSLAKGLYQRLDLRSMNSPIHLLECGAGTGAFSEALASMHSQRIKVSAVDISTKMIQQARTTFDKAGLSADLRVGDIRKLPQADSSQDIVIAAHVLEHLAEPHLALCEMYRVLKPGGLIVLCCTQRTIPGRWIQMKWRTHVVTERLLRDWLKQHTFEQIAPLDICSSSPLHRMSKVMIAHKPQALQKAA